jgi:hypothetical protein
MRPFVYAELTSSEPRGREYSLWKGLALNGRVLSEDGCCTCSIPRKVLGMHIPNAELVSFKIRLDLPKVEVCQGESRRYHPLYSVWLSICMIVSVYYWIWKLLIYSARINGPRTYLPFP